MTSRRPNALLQLTLWRVREFLREPEALFWVFAFPIVLAFALGIAFKNRVPQRLRIAVEQGPGAAALATALDSAPGLHAVVLAASEASLELRTGRVALVAAAPEPVLFRYDSTRAEGRWPGSSPTMRCNGPAGDVTCVTREKSGSRNGARGTSTSSCPGCSA